MPASRLDIVCNTAGLPMPQTEVSIRSVDGENRILPVGEVGEICVRGYCVMIGYHDNPSATAEAIDAESWLHTGDLGTLDRQGYLRITGRVKEMIIRGGENLFPAEIENTLLEHPDVAEVAVVGLPDEKWGEIVACFVRLEPGRVRSGGIAPPLPRPDLAPEDARGLAGGRGLPAHRIGQDPEIRAGRGLSGGGGLKRPSRAGRRSSASSQASATDVSR